jgi:LPXTG-motif cell wall-anchored protein
MHRRLTVTALAAALVVLGATPAFADPPSYSDTVHVDTTGVTLVPDATATVESDGLRLSTPSTAAQATFAVPLLTPTSTTYVPLLSVVDASYKTYKIDTEHPDTLPAYKIEIYCDATAKDPKYTTLVFEPYLQDPKPTITPNTWQSWHVSAGTFWSTRDIGGGFGQKVGDPPAVNHSDQRDLTAIKALCPAGVVLSFGVGQGSSNDGVVAKVDQVRFAASTYPVPAAPATPEAAVDGTPTDAVLVAAVDNGTPFSASHVWRLPPPTLPKTGTDVTPFVIAGAALLVIGALALSMARRRRTA